MDAKPGSLRRSGPSAKENRLERFERSAASHFVWFKPGIGMFPVPVHKGMVKYVYVREIQKLNEAAQG